MGKIRFMLRNSICRVLVGFGLIAGSGGTAFAHEHHDHDPEGPTIQERLGFPADAKLLIVHADDLGMSHSKNVATIESMQRGIVTSASIMMPTPWVGEAVAMAKANPELDMGVHLTLTAEWKHYKWGPLLGADDVPSLVTEAGVFHDNVPDFAAAADVAEAEAEVRAQIDQALASGVEISHLDGHMGSMLATDEIAAMYVRVANDYRLPFRLHQHGFEDFDEARLRTVMQHYAAAYTSIGGAPPDTYPDGMINYYNDWLRSLQPGLNLMVVHVGFDDPEMQAIMVEHPLWGARWRQIDYDWTTSPETKAIMEEEGIILIDNRLLRDKLIRAQD
ncbi:MAG: carbohydrate deacetylase [Synoicihabitans sp.]